MVRTCVRIAFAVLAGGLAPPSWGQDTPESLLAPPAPLTDAARELAATPASQTGADPGRVGPAVAPAIDPEAERIAIWNSPEMRAGRAWVREQMRSSQRADDTRARRYLYELARLDADGMRRWLAQLAQLQQQQSLHRRIEAEAAWRFQLVRAAVAEQHRSRYLNQVALRQEELSRSAAQAAQAAQSARQRATAAGRRAPPRGACGDTCAPSRADVLVYGTRRP